MKDNCISQLLKKLFPNYKTMNKLSPAQEKRLGKLKIELTKTLRFEGIPLTMSVTKALEEFIDIDLNSHLAVEIALERQKVLKEVMKLADHQIKQKAIFLPQYIKGINKAGKELEEVISKLKNHE